MSATAKAAFVVNEAINCEGKKKTAEFVIKHHIDIEEGYKTKYNVKKPTFVLILDGACAKHLRLWQQLVP